MTWANIMYEYVLGESILNEIWEKAEFSEALKVYKKIDYF